MKRETLNRGERSNMREDKGIANPREITERSRRKRRRSGRRRGKRRSGRGRQRMNGRR